MGTLEQPSQGEDLAMSETNDVTEQPVLAEAAPEPAPMDPVEEAAMRFTNLLPYVRKIADASPSKGSLVRVLHALSAWPLEGRHPRLMNDNERQLFNICSELQGYKNTIIQSIVTKELESKKQAKEKENE